MPHRADQGEPGSCRGCEAPATHFTLDIAGATMGRPLDSPSIACGSGLESQSAGAWRCVEFSSAAGAGAADKGRAFAITPATKSSASSGEIARRFANRLTCFTRKYSPL
jgi:hypothetical protein